MLTIQDLRDCLEYRFEFVRERSHRPRLFPDTDFHRNGQYKDQDQDRQPGSANGSAILVKNLPPMFEIPQICQMFASLGLVIGTQIVSSAKEHHNNMRTAVVQFYGPLDAGNAVSFAVSPRNGSAADCSLTNMHKEPLWHRGSRRALGPLVLPRDHSHVASSTTQFVFEAVDERNPVPRSPCCCDAYASHAEHGGRYAARRLQRYMICSRDPFYASAD